MAYPYHSYAPQYMPANPIVPSAQVGYQTPMYQQSYDPLKYQPQLNVNNSAVIWVQGEAGAKSYLVAPNSTVLLMDSDCSRFYLKSADNAGVPSLRTFEYKELEHGTTPRPETVPDLDSRYVTREEYGEEHRRIESQYKEILARFDALGEQTAKASAARKSNKGANVDE